jgi:hypothetical protein
MRPEVLQLANTGVAKLCLKGRGTKNVNSSAKWWRTM